MNSDYFTHSTAVIDDGATIGAGTKIWHFSHVYARAVIGENCSFGQNTMVAGGVVIGDNVKVQNNVSIYSGTEVESDVFLGPSCVLTNVSNPRSEVVRRGSYEKTLIKRGVTVGANATVVCGITLGRFSFVAAGAVVTRDVPDYGFVAGVPARHRGWMSRHGHMLNFQADRTATCRESRLKYALFANDHGQDAVRCLDLAEESQLPTPMGVGNSPYRTFNSQESSR